MDGAARLLASSSGPLTDELSRSRHRQYRLKWALYADDARPVASPERQGAVFIENIDRLADDDWQHLAARAMLGSNVANDAVRRRVEEQMDRWDVAPRWVVPSTQAGGVTNGYDHPTRLGADRWWR